MERDDAQLELTTPRQMRHVTLGLLLLLTALCSPTRTEAQADAVGRALIEAINSGDSTRIRGWADTSWVPSIYPRYRESIYALYRRVQLSSGGLDLIAANGDRSLILDVRVRRTGRRARMRLGMEPGTEASPKISGWQVYPYLDPMADGPWPRTKLSDSALRELLTQRFASAAARDEFSGVVRIMKGDALFFESAHGWAQRGLQAPNRMTTRFPIASQGKMFTAVAIAQLVDRGTLRFSDTVANVLPEYPNRDVARRITVHQLLTHTSGLGFGPPAPSTGADWRTPSALSDIAAFANEALSFQPGTRSQYSNAGFAVLAAIVERVSGENFHEYVQRHILTRAGMTRTDIGVLDDPDDDRAVGYGWFDDDPLGANPRRPFWVVRGRHAGGAGGQYSTARDMTRFAQHLRSGQLVDITTAGTLTARQSAPAVDYGYGFASYAFIGADSTRRAAAGHTGGGIGAGMDGGVMWFTDGSWTVAVLGNYDAPSAQQLLFGVMRTLAWQ